MAKKNFMNSVKMTRHRSNYFNLSRDVKSSMQMGKLYPMLIVDCVPGDRVKLGCEMLIRMAPMVTPPMHTMYARMHYYFVPKRLLWDNWENYITNTKVAGVLPAHPYFELLANGSNYYDLMDYYGIPKGTTDAGDAANLKINMLPFVAYSKIYNEYYRDQNQIAASKDFVDSDGPQTMAAYDLNVKRCAWMHDYFTSALPWPQKGDGVDVPLGNVEGNAHIFNMGSNEADGLVDAGAAGNIDVPYADAGEPAFAEKFWAETDGLSIEPTTINSLRVAMRLQQWLEKLARGGSRLKEMIWSMFGVDTGDARLQRPEYICGVKSPLRISEVLNTTGTEEAPQGSMSGHGVGVVDGNYGYYNVKEHGFVIGLMSVLPTTGYMQGVEKLWLKINSPQEHYFTDFANLGEQAIVNDELYAYTPTGANTWGYLPRYAEYKTGISLATGQMRQSLDHWHLIRKWSAGGSEAPGLNQAFIEADPTKRIFAVDDPDVDDLYVHCFHKISANRLMPIFGTPTY